MGRNNIPFMTRRARELRRNATQEEALLWQGLRKKNAGYKIRRQHPLGTKVVDFYCHEARLAIEIDGNHHDAMRDELRDTELSVVKVLRFTNQQVQDNVFDVLAAIAREIEERIQLRKGIAPSPRSPRSGEGVGGEA